MAREGTRCRNGPASTYIRGHCPFGYLQSVSHLQATFRVVGTVCLAQKCFEDGWGPDTGLLLWGLGTMVPRRLGSKSREETQTCPGGHSGKFHLNLVDINSFSYPPAPSCCLLAHLSPGVPRLVPPQSCGGSARTQPLWALLPGLHPSQPLRHAQAGPAVALAHAVSSTRSARPHLALAIPSHPALVSPNAMDVGAYVALSVPLGVATLRVWSTAPVSG